MSTQIFPIVQPEAETPAEESLPLCREIAWDYAENLPRFSAGQPVEVTGRDAVAVWCWKALNTARGRFEIYTRDFGTDTENLIGQSCTDDVKQSEAVRYVREALEPNPYVSAVRQIGVEFEGERLTISCTVSTIYGEVEIHV